MVTMAQIDEARGRANEALEAYRAALRAAAAEWSWPREAGRIASEQRLAEARAEVETLLAAWWAQGCREAFVPYDQTIRVALREPVEFGDLVTVDGRRAAGPLREDGTVRTHDPRCARYPVHAPPCRDAAGADLPGAPVERTEVQTWGDEEAWKPASGEALDRIALDLGVRRRGWRWLPAWLRRWLEPDQKFRRRVMDVFRKGGSVMPTIDPKTIAKAEARALFVATLAISREAGTFVRMKADARTLQALQAMGRARLAEHARTFDPIDPPRWEDDLDFEVLGPEKRDPLLAQDHSYVLNLVPMTPRGEALLAAINPLGAR
jgi:hypothetical protein